MAMTLSAALLLSLALALALAVLSPLAAAAPLSESRNAVYVNVNGGTAEVKMASLIAKFDYGRRDEEYALSVNGKPRVAPFGGICIGITNLGAYSYVR